MREAASSVVVHLCIASLSEDCMLTDPMVMTTLTGLSTPVLSSKSLVLALYASCMGD